MTENKDNSSILVVDDNPDNLRLLADILSTHNYKVRPAQSGARALATIKKKIPNLILLDIMMPGMDGFEVCRHLKADELLWFKINGHFAKNVKNESEVPYECPKNKTTLHSRI